MKDMILMVMISENVLQLDYGLEMLLNAHVSMIVIIYHNTIIVYEMNDNC